MTPIRTAQNYQNIATPEKRAQSTQLLLTFKINCSGLGWIVGRPSGLKPHQTLGLRSVIPLQTALHCLGQGEKQCFFATHLEYRAFHCDASANIHSQPSEGISEPLATQSPGC
jgi:hypothetical protein